MSKKRQSGVDRHRIRLENARVPPANPRKIDAGIISLRDAALGALLFCATLLAYWPVFQGGLLWDDAAHVTRLELQPLHGLGRIWFDLGATQQYYPLLHSAFWIEHRIWGDALLGYHLTNITLHALSAFLVVLIVRRLSLPGAWLVGSVFALHPVCVEAVAWISEQKSTLSGVFYLASALTYLRFDETRRRQHYFLALGLFALALLTKTVTATLPAALLVVLWWKRGRLAWQRDVLPLVPWIALGAPAGLFTAWVEKTYVGASGNEFALTLLDRFLLAGRAIWFYACKLVWPANLIFSYPRWKLDPQVWWQYLFLVGALAVASALCLLARRNRGPLAGFLIFAGTLFPVLGFLNVLPFRYSFVADHFQYVASLGIIVPVTSALMIAVGRSPLQNVGKIAIPALLLLALGLLTWRQCGMYRDVETLYRETIARNPDSCLAHNNLGTVLFLMPGRLTDAIAEFETALRIQPDNPEAHENLGNAFSELPGRLPDAIAEYHAALRNRPGFADAHDNLGNALLRIPDRLPEAISEFQAALRIDPNFAEAHSNLGNALMQIPPRLPEAIAEFQAALRINPNIAALHFNLGNALIHMPGRLPDAITEYQAALRLDPNLAEAHNNLAYALAQIPGRLSEAIAECETALRIKPDFEPARQLMAQLRTAQK
jgi:tetratricopeptide (TPR) repeat protein